MDYALPRQLAQHQKAGAKDKDFRLMAGLFMLAGFAGLYLTHPSLKHSAASAWTSLEDDQRQTIRTQLETWCESRWHHAEVRQVYSQHHLRLTQAFV